MTTLAVTAVTLIGCGKAQTEDTVTVYMPPVPDVPEAYIEPPDLYAGKLIISELNANNKACLKAPDGSFPDWVELYNDSSETLDLSEWRLSDGTHVCGIGDGMLEPGERVLVYASKDAVDGGHWVNFSFSEGETIATITPMGSVSHSALVICTDGRSECLLDGNNVKLETPVVSTMPTPGFPNTVEGYEQYQQTLIHEGPLVITEAITAASPDSFSYSFGGCDWIELKNISSSSVSLSDYCLSDSRNNYSKYPLPEKDVAPGETVLILCDDKEHSGYLRINLSISSDGEGLYLSSGEKLEDYMYIHDVPLNCSYGILEGQPGYFYFNDRTPGRANANGYRRVSSMPETDTRDGVYDGTETIVLDLSAAGPIYYTTDGSKPTTESNEYKEPLTIEETCVIRAVAVEDGALPSDTLTLSFFVNEGIKLPIISLATDSPNGWRSIFVNGFKDIETPGSIALYDGEDGFKLDCGLTVSGKSSLSYAKKNIKIRFRGAYGTPSLKYDVFDTGIADYAALSLRAAQDSDWVMFTNEIWQDLCMEMTDSVYTQHGRFCIVFVNGKYYGIYSLKEDISRTYYANLTGCSAKSVSSSKPPDEMDEEFDEVLDFCKENDFSDEKVYDEFCKIFDVDGLIDWIIIEGVSQNYDMWANARYIYSAEGDGKWQVVLFDLDMAMRSDYVRPFENFTRANHYLCSQNRLIVESVFSSRVFMDKLALRYAEVYDTFLSNEKVLERIDYYSRLLEPEVERDWEEWYYRPEEWYNNVEHLRSEIMDKDWQNYCVDCFCKYLGIDRATYFD